jgi:D-arabinose 1-dehydrogenase-like Zn-dependent alcohol dehydrogenase
MTTPQPSPPPTAANTAGHTMRAAQFPYAGGAIEMTTKPVPAPRAGEVRVRVEACGICAGDLHVQQNGFPGIQFPRVPGHEIAGTVDAVGTGVTRWQVGDCVGVGFHGGHCFACDACREGDFTSCEHALITGAHFDGGFAECTVVPEAALAVVPAVLDVTEAAPLMCAGLTTFNALRHSGARVGETVAVFGIGGLGHLAVQFAAKMGFLTVAIARGVDKAPLAQELGATHYIDSGATDATEALQALGGATVILVTAPAAEAASALVSGLRRNGTMVVVADTGSAALSVLPRQLIFGSRTLRGWYSGHAKDAEETLAFAAQAGIRPMIEVFPLAQVRDALERTRTGQARFRTVLLLRQ